MISQETTAVNRFLDQGQLEAVLESLLIDRPVKILRVIARTGKFAQSTSWVYFQNEISGQKLATFVSFKDLLEGFWIWMETANLLLMAMFQRIAIDRIIYTAIHVGEIVYNNEFGIGKIINKFEAQGMGIPSFKIDFMGRTEVVRASSITSKK